MATMTDPIPTVTIGVDTHKDTHVAAALDDVGRLLGTASFPTTLAGYRELYRWARSWGEVTAAGIEATGCYGVGLTRHLTSAGVCCVEVNRPNRQHRRRHGKSDTTDAIGAARAVLSGEATAEPRGNNGIIEALRVNRVARRSATKARTQAINQIRSLITTAPEPLRARFASPDGKDLSASALINIAAAMRPNRHAIDPINTTKTALVALARRARYLQEELDDLARQRQALIDTAAPAELLAEHGIGPAVAADLLIAFGDNPHRIGSEAAFAALCGVSPIDASSGRQQRHRLNRGGDRHANNALWRIATVRLAHHQPTRTYMTNALANGKTKREAIRNLKRYIARHIWRTLTTHQPPRHL